METPAYPFCFLINGRTDSVQSFSASSVLLASPFNRTTRLNMLATSFERTHLPGANRAGETTLLHCRRTHVWVGIVERLELRPGLVEWHKRNPTDPERLAVLLVVQAVVVRDRAGQFDRSEKRRGVTSRI